MPRKDEPGRAERIADHASRVAAEIPAAELVKQLARQARHRRSGRNANATRGLPRNDRPDYNWPALIDRLNMLARHPGWSE
jgi:hypothetical protein